MPSSPAQPIERIVVVGASVAGLFAAAAVAGSGRHVTVLERDRLPSEAQARPGVPQGRQPHVFLYRGLLAAQKLLPGLRANLVAAGAVPLDTGNLSWLGEAGWVPTRKGFEIVSMTRPLFEDVLRRRVSALPGVVIRDRIRVTGIHRADPGWRVAVAAPDQAAADDAAPEAQEVEPQEVGPREVQADLLIDASGRSSRFPVWLADSGIGPARTTELDARIGYATRCYRGRSATPGLTGVVIFATPDEPQGGLALPVENDGWLVMEVGAGDQRPPRDEAGFESFLAGLRDPALDQLIQHCTPDGPVAIHRQTGNLRHHYEELAGWPDDLLVMGDAFCAFNPIYGQGIAVAACEAELLQQTLSSGRGPTSGWALQLLRGFAQVTALPWSIAIGQDLRYRTSTGEPTRLQALTNRWSMEIGKLGTHGNNRAADTLVRVYNLMAPGQQLFHPALFLASVQARIRGYGPASPRPPALRGLPTTDG